jgi:hypothetical protein
MSIENIKREKSEFRQPLQPTSPRGHEYRREGKWMDANFWTEKMSIKNGNFAPSPDPNVGEPENEPKTFRKSTSRIAKLLEEQAG